MNTSKFLVVIQSYILQGIKSNEILRQHLHFQNILYTENGNLGEFKYRALCSYLKLYTKIIYVIPPMQTNAGCGLQRYYECKHRE